MLAIVWVSGLSFTVSIYFRGVSRRGMLLLLGDCCDTRRELGYLGSRACIYVTASLFVQCSLSVRLLHGPVCFAVPLHRWRHAAPEIQSTIQSLSLWLHSAHPGCYSCRVVFFTGLLLSVFTWGVFAPEVYICLAFLSLCYSCLPMILAVLMVCPLL